MEKQITHCSMQAVPCDCTWWFVTALAAGTTAIAPTSLKQIEQVGEQKRSVTETQQDKEHA